MTSHFGQLFHLLPSGTRLLEPAQLPQMKFLLLAIIASAQLADAHMRMVSPLPRGHPKNSAYAPIDYDLVAPLGGAKTFPCGGKGKGTPTASVRGGESITVQLEGSATHNGGHCQFALSCNGQSTNFVVLKSVLNDCPLTNAFDVPIPSGANGECVLSWTWINASVCQPVREC